MPYRLDNLPGAMMLRERFDDLPERCTCCDPRKQLILIPDDRGITLKCPSTGLAFHVRHGDNRIIPGVALGPNGFVDLGSKGR